MPQIADVGFSISRILKNMLDLVYAGQIDLKQAYSHNIEQAFDDLYLLLANLLVSQYTVPLKKFPNFPDAQR